MSEPFTPTEVFYSAPGVAPKRRTFRTQAALDRFIDSLDDDYIVAYRDEER